MKMAGSDLRFLGGGRSTCTAKYATYCTSTSNMTRHCPNKDICWLCRIENSRRQMIIESITYFQSEVSVLGTDLLYGSQYKFL